MTNLLTGTANKSEVPVVDVTEQMPKQYDSLTDWVAALVDSITTAIDSEYGCTSDGDDANGEDSGEAQDSQDGQSEQSEQSDKTDASADAKDSDTSTKQKKCTTGDGDDASQSGDTKSGTEN